MTARLLVMGGHEFDRLDGNEAICDHIIELSGSESPKICLLPTASGDPEDQNARFRRSFGTRGCRVSDISLFRLGANPIDVEAHLLDQDVIYIGGGSLVNLVAVWQAHGIAGLVRDCLDGGVLICGQSAGGMCWFQQGVTTSSGRPQVAPGFGLLEGSMCVHYHRDPDRRELYLAEVAAGLAHGYGADDQTALLFEDGRLAEAMSFRKGAGVFRVEAEAGTAGETELEAVDRSPRRPAEDRTASALEDFRRHNIFKRHGGPAARR